MFGMQVSFGTIWAWKFAISVLLGDRALGGSIDPVGHDRWPTRCAGQNASSALGSHHVCSCRVSANIGRHAGYRLSARPCLLTIVRLAVSGSKGIEAGARRCRSERLRVCLARRLLSLIALVRRLLLLLLLLLLLRLLCLLLLLLLLLALRLGKQGRRRQTGHVALWVHVRIVSIVRCRRGNRRRVGGRSVSRQVIAVLLLHVTLVRRGQLRVVDGREVSVVLVRRHGIRRGHVVWIVCILRRPNVGRRRPRQRLSRVHYRDGRFKWSQRTQSTIELWGEVEVIKDEDDTADGYSSIDKKRVDSSGGGWCCQ